MVFLKIRSVTAKGVSKEECENKNGVYLSDTDVCVIPVDMDIRLDNALLENKEEKK